MTTQQTEPETYITDEVKKAIGAETDWGELSEPADPERIRRFIQGIMDDDPIYWDEAYAKQTKYGGLVAPPLFPGAVNRRKPGTSDPLDALKTNPDLDGLGAGGGTGAGGEGGRGRGGGLPRLDFPGLVRTLNGGTAAEFFRYLKPGDRVKSKQRLADVVERQGREGKMVITTTETIYHDQDDKLVAIIRSTGIRR